MENLNMVVAKLNVYCPKFVISHHEELQRVFESNEYCVKVFPIRSLYSDWNKSYVLRFEFEDCRYPSGYDRQVEQETEEQRNYNEDDRITAISTKEILNLNLADRGSDVQSSKKPSANGDTDQHSLSNEPRDVVSSVITTELGGNSSTSATTKSSIPTGSAETQSHKTTDGGHGDFVFDHQSLTKHMELKIQHALHHCVHKETEKTGCPYYADATMCEPNLDKDIIESVRCYLSNASNATYDDYVVDHLSNRKCGAYCPLWYVHKEGGREILAIFSEYPTSDADLLIDRKFYLNNGMHFTHESVLKYADEGLVLHSGINQDKIGTISKEFADYSEKEEIGSGGFGKVYKCGDVAVKEERKRPLIIANSEIFKQITQIKHVNVISMQEYIVGKMIDPEKGKRAFLFTMPYLNERGLHKQFKSHDCIIDYMKRYPDEQEAIFRNFLLIFLHLFQGLEYLHDKGIVHGDVKDSNILVQQNCHCLSPLRCSCHGLDGVNYVLADMDLLCMDGQSVSGKYVEWTEAKLHEPAGTYGMKASELYFTGKNGEPCGSRKSDIWAGCVAMMNILIGKRDCNKANSELAIIPQFTSYFKEITLSGNRYTRSISTAYEKVTEIQKSVRLLDFSQERPKDVLYLSKKATEIISKFKNLKDLLRTARVVERTCSVSEYTYSEKFPLEFILSAFCVANGLYHPCLDKLPEIYRTQLWKVMKGSMQIITSGIRFLPQNRPTATDITGKLIALQSDIAS